MLRRPNLSLHHHVLYCHLHPKNNDTAMQSYHLDSYSFFVVGMNYGNWTKDSRPRKAIQISY
ncbi:Multicopper oxidase, C-terminal [Dillenia turbinata]|uniref:Multicopper oxidase, C-terminal n=1 Tax=Dillenia turbinata TaxID=194707 RepID=A0AAN8YWQ0_9MAGN